MRWIVPCPAKLNLFLSVGPIDRRGYHPLRTLFQAIDLCDELRIEPADEDAFVCDDPRVPAENTVTRARRLLRELVELPPLRIELIKRIPTQSGLGGGSSDAAGLLRAAGAISGVTIPAGELQGLALTIGADVPFFLLGGRARAEGYGERLTPLEDHGGWYVIAKPEAGSDTAAAFRALDALTYEWAPFPEDDRLYNDFERVAPCASTELIERLLALGAAQAGLTGSGSAVFGLVSDRDRAERIASRLRSERVPFVQVARALSRAESLTIEALPG